MTSKPYVPTNNLNNKKKCDVVRMRKTFDESQGTSAKAKASKEFDEYVKKYKKTYPNEEAKERARQNFIAASTGATNLNRARCSNNDAQFATTRYSDWTTKDFVEKLGGAREDSEPSKLPPPFTVTEDQSRFLWKLPRLDWRTYGVLPPVRDQKGCGGCYSFATTDLLAAQERIDKNELDSDAKVEPYSAQYFIDCMPQPYGYGCKGGRPAAVLDYMTKCTDCAILIDRCYQYRNKFLRCKQPSINCKAFTGAKVRVDLTPNRPTVTYCLSSPLHPECDRDRTRLVLGEVHVFIELGTRNRFESKFYGTSFLLRIQTDEQKL